MSLGAWAMILQRMSLGWTTVGNPDFSIVLNIKAVYIEGQGCAIVTSIDTLGIALMVWTMVFDFIVMTLV